MRVPANDIHPGDLIAPDLFETQPKLVISVQHNSLQQVDIVTLCRGHVTTGWSSWDWKYEILNDRKRT